MRSSAASFSINFQRPLRGKAYTSLLQESSWLTSEYRNESISSRLRSEERQVLKVDGAHEDKPHNAGRYNLQAVERHFEKDAVY